MTYWQNNAASLTGVSYKPNALNPMQGWLGCLYLWKEPTPIAMKMFLLFLWLAGISTMWQVYQSTDRIKFLISTKNKK